MAKAIGDLMSTKIETIEVTATAEDAAKKMRDKNVSSLIVVDSANKNTGILTERDLVRRVCASGAKSNEVPISQIMSSPIATIDPYSPVEVAADNMLHNKIRHLLVTNKDGMALGVLTLTDLAAFMSENVDLDEVNATILEALKEEGGFSS